ncbi:MAG: hypothetical protein IJ428_04075 [Clostridia bacterium]|nr:hypothetical protein [Clostridia bacterium]
MKKLALLLGALILAGTFMTACSGDGHKNGGDGVYTDVSEYTEGVTSAEGYESAWSGIKFTASDSITMADDEELAEIAALEDGAIYEMMATDNTNYDTVLVRTLSAGEGVTFEDYLTAQLDSIKSQYEANGLNVEYSELDNATFGGRSYRGALYTVSMNGTAIYQCVYRAMLGDRISEVYFTYSDEAAFNALMDCFAE